MNDFAFPPSLSPSRFIPGFLVHLKKTFIFAKTIMLCRVRFFSLPKIAATPCTITQADSSAKFTDLPHRRKGG